MGVGSNAIVPDLVRARLRGDARNLDLAVVNDMPTIPDGARHGGESLRRTRRKPVISIHQTECERAVTATNVALPSMLPPRKIWPS